jgi:hypothetical protein
MFGFSKKTIIVEDSDSFLKCVKRIQECLPSAILREYLVRSCVFKIVDLSIHRRFCTFRGASIPLKEGESARLYEFVARKWIGYKDDVDSEKLKYL